MGLIDSREALAFSRNLEINQNYLGDTLFPDRKTQFLESEYDAISQIGLLPTIAPVHAFDTEAVIGERPTFQQMKLEKLLLKKKINQTERLQQVLNYGMTDSDIKNKVFDDMAYLFNAVKASAEFRKMQLLGKGELHIVENNLNYIVDYGVPTKNKKRADWLDPIHDIFGDIQEWVDQLAEQGSTPDLAITSNKIVRMIAKNEGIQTKIFGTSGKGTHVSLNAINDLFEGEFGFRIIKNDSKFAEELFANGKKVRSTQRFFPETSFALFTTGTDGTAGAGLWGVTPEEHRLMGANWDINREELFVTLTQWTDDDPVAVWSKGSGLFTPVLPDPAGLLVATISVSQVDVPIEDIHILPFDTTMTEGQVQTIYIDVDPTNATNAKDLIYESSDTGVALIDGAGQTPGTWVLGAQGEGTCTITFRAPGEPTIFDSVDVTVKAEEN